jgi:hypothetical protein
MLTEINNIAKEQLILQKKAADIWKVYVDGYWTGIDTEEEFHKMKAELLSNKELVEINALVVLQSINMKVSQLNLSEDHKVTLLSLIES